MLKSFLKRISEFTEQELSEWLMEGLTACHGDNRPPPCDAFPYATLSFKSAFAPGITAPDDLEILFSNLNSDNKIKFDKALARTIGNVETNPKVLEDLLETGLRIESNRMVEAVTKKLSSPDRNPELVKAIHAFSGFILMERSDAEYFKSFAAALLNNDDYPVVISPHLIVALCKSDFENASAHAQKMKPKLTQQLASLQEHPRGYSRFLSDIAKVLPSGSPALKILDLSP